MYYILSCFIAYYYIILYYIMSFYIISYAVIRSTAGSRRPASALRSGSWPTRPTASPSAWYHMCIYIYIYIERERDIEKERGREIDGEIER